MKSGRPSGRKNLIALGLGGALVLIGVGSGVGVWLWNRPEGAVSVSVGGSVALDNGDVAGNSAAESIEAPRGTGEAQSGLPMRQPSVSMPPGQSNQQERSLKVNGDAVTTQDDFSQYDQYKTGQTAMYSDTQPGAGDEAQVGKVVTVHYRGYLTNGQIFDESYARKEPFSFTIGQGQVISGWEAGLVGMKVGGKRRLIVPPAAGYGSRAVGSIPPESVLIFDIELLQVK